MIKRGQVSKSKVTGEAEILEISEIVEEIEVVEVEVKVVEILGLSKEGQEEEMIETETEGEVDLSESESETVKGMEVWGTSNVVEVEIIEVGESIEREGVVEETEAIIEATSE